MRWLGQGSGRSGGVREPAVAGRFYTGRADRLAAEVDGYVATAQAALAAVEHPPEGRQVAIVVPHAGHIYSGPTAAFAYAAVDPEPVRRVVLFGPAHYVPVDGVGLSTASAWRTPLGDIPLDAELADDLRANFDCVGPADAAHAPEHSLEVQLPFLQRVLADDWQLVPLIVGSDVPEELADVIERCASLPGTLIVVSTDLSHYLDHQEAVARDERTIRAILARRAREVGPQDACGRFPLRGLLTAAVRHDWSVRLLDARNSGDTAGDWDRVVGYAAFLVCEQVGSQASGQSAATAAAEPRDASTPAGAGRGPDPTDERPSLSAEARARLLELARGTIEVSLATGGRRPRLDERDWSPELRAPGAAFVTLRSGRGDLLGCIGSLSAHQPLAADVAEHAFDAAFRDPRFRPLTAEQAEDMVVDISVLTAPRAFPCAGYEDLLARIPVGSGLVVTAGRHRATFLPAVWEQLPDPAAFLAALWRKAGLAPGEWPAGTRIEVYSSEEFAEAAARRPGG